MVIDVVNQMVQADQDWRLTKILRPFYPSTISERDAWLVKSRVLENQVRSLDSLHQYCRGEQVVRKQIRILSSLHNAAVVSITLCHCCLGLDSYL